MENLKDVEMVNEWINESIHPITGIREAVYSIHDNGRRKVRPFQYDYIIDANI